MTFRSIFFWLINFLSIPLFFREFIQKNKVSILLFHDLDFNYCETIFNFLLKNYNIIHLQDYIEAVKNNNYTKIPEKALIITFDDGHINNYKLLPAIKKFSLPITIFLCTGIINTNRKYWFTLPLNKNLKNKLKNISNSERLNILSNLGFSQTKEYAKKQSLQKNHILEMKDYVNFQSHTLFHPCLPKCTDKEAEFELDSSKYLLENDYGIKINALSYPNGDYCERDIKFSKNLGYECGITVDPGYNSFSSDLFKLKRFSVNDTCDINELAVKSSGFYSFFKSIFFR